MCVNSCRHRRTVDRMPLSRNSLMGSPQYRTAIIINNYTNVFHIYYYCIDTCDAHNIIFFHTLIEWDFEWCANMSIDAAT